MVDLAAAVAEEITIPVQVNGKVRDRIVVPAGTPDDAIKALALSSGGALRYVADTPPKQVVVVKGRLVNIVV